MNTTDVLIYIDIFMDVLLIAFFIWTVNKVDKAGRIKMSGKYKFDGHSLKGSIDNNKN
jgi:hypothetical protein